MLQVKNVVKKYMTGSFSLSALDDVSINFSKSEFVAILGHSGSGKTTFLNIVGGLDRYDSGDIVVNSVSTKSFRTSDWDAYRNNSIGFIFQNYNLISHLTILENVELGLTLTGVNANERQTKALELLDRVGLKEHAKKKPGQLSGGEMQRVAIARALINDPDIILADEPTGALDSATSIQILNLIKEVAKDKLVIMVTHNSQLAEEFADRIIRFSDGKVISDTKTTTGIIEQYDYSLKKTSMSFFTALKLSARNITTKKWRTALTSFASSIGIIGIALILSLSSGFQDKVNEFEADALSEFPIMISKSAMQMDQETLEEHRKSNLDIFTGNKEYIDSDEVFLYDAASNSVIHENVFSDEFLAYIKAIDPSICHSIGYTYITGMNLVKKEEDLFKPISISAGFTSSGGRQGMSSMDSAGLASYPTVIREGEESYLEKNYDVLSGEYPKDYTDIVLVVDSKNRVDQSILKNLGFDIHDKESIKFEDIVGLEFKLIGNNEYYIKTDFGSYIPGEDYKAMYDSNNSFTIKISGIIRLKKDIKIGLLGHGVVYSDDLITEIHKNSINSDIVKDQIKSDKSVFTMADVTEEEKKSILLRIGGDTAPFMIFLYPASFTEKDEVLAYLNIFNEGKEKEDLVVYTDMASSITKMTGGILDGITIVLVAFAAISLVVSLIMIGIITYISVLERTKEIGILRALGARKKDITRVFNAETFIIGSLSGLLGIAIAYLLTIPINLILYNLTGLSGVSALNPLHAILLIIISISLTLLGGTIPARMAAKMDPVQALRSE